jgi:hypothetical protein
VSAPNAKLMDSEVARLTLVGAAEALEKARRQLEFAHWLQFWIFLGGMAIGGVIVTLVWFLVGA